MTPEQAAQAVHIMVCTAGSNGLQPILLQMRPQVLNALPKQPDIFCPSSKAPGNCVYMLAIGSFQGLPVYPMTAEGVALRCS